ncbi:MAG: D-glycero-beta-D-manno-heptose-1,7-bisphosphate 7-phosphatase [Candidatus Dactylopiibacterium carminicum]|uniref:D,D-heptose 1,7-bisphosphate phosphatase n=1 Tax=Candidatus Dactylopiibacterium carminicum TaxID=857335 RepID=A0A272ESN5_9RHOO|nr:D-glycero-beta-D-manno-heptose 1,7-bisphosphate 7-phosphatase [Candidatus Dactylopiibacterium carminicum]KAF7598814.1 D-glycero-beta-D-manno-heptose-1,7-bisphosphate 7-phosphatase [Candidatus Dactylopiibacterium carminicum]PAS92730.1 MAG: D-glycero-beta-D-manno-heptose-1,7-bisphosphate 7-phosphatase [Candidatus Dactylopiibacterium carminicum]PAS96178.1 MAG: D-glycero-beta-D-manno-heptose-1,7-bisphosphate 7-phosphatase [Candidatus Dactylopiibacterium carminicum]PAS98837.1 MAG: D-glycero-beta-
MKLIILDRDGVINHDSAQFIKSPEEWKPIPGSLDAIARLTEAGYRIIVATNQSGVGRGLFDMDTLNAIHDKMLKAVSAVGGRIDAIFFCPHPAESTCECRKPKSGMFREIAERFNVDLTGVPTVGDSLRDLQAGIAVGCVPYLVLTGKSRKTAENPELPAGTRVAADLNAVANQLLGFKA